MRLLLLDTGLFGSFVGETTHGCTVVYYIRSHILRTVHQVWVHFLSTCSNSYFNSCWFEILTCPAGAELSCNNTTLKVHSFLPKVDQSVQFYILSYWLHSTSKPTQSFQTFLLDKVLHNCRGWCTTFCLMFCQ
jgi:hypothetical protein